MVIKRRTLSQNRKLAKKTGMSLAECKAMDAAFIKQQKVVSKMRKEEYQTASKEKQKWLRGYAKKTGQALW